MVFHFGVTTASRTRRSAAPDGYGGAILGANEPGVIDRYLANAGGGAGEF